MACERCNGFGKRVVLLPRCERTGRVWVLRGCLLCLGDGRARDLGVAG